MSFKDMVAADLHGVFLNSDEFAERRTVIYDGVEYPEIPVVVNGIKEKDRVQNVSDHAQGLFLVSHIIHLAASDLGGNIPEKGSRLKICSNGDRNRFFERFYVASVQETAGMLRLELEAIAE